MNDITPSLNELAELYLPKYLTPETKQQLTEELGRFPENLDYYLHDEIEGYLQGDCWNGFTAINFDTLAKKNVSGIIISNSCDIDPSNPHPRKRSILFSPIIPLANYVKLLKNSGKTSSQIENIKNDIKKQLITYIFYLPENGDLFQESIILLDDIHNHPLDNFQECIKVHRLTLNQYAFYIFIIKLSIHFTRFQEGVNRLDS